MFHSAITGRAPRRGLLENIFPENIRTDLNEYQAKAKQKVSERIQQKAKEKVIDYSDKERRSLDKMIEGIVEIGDIDE